MEAARELAVVPETLVPTQLEMSRDVKRLLACRAAMEDVIEALQYAEN